MNLSSFMGLGRVLAWLALGGITLAPFLSVQVLGLGDTLNHLARMHILATIATSPELQRFYEVHWTPIPYLAMDAVVPLLARVLPIYVAGKVFVIACVLMPVLGCACVHYAVHRRFSLVPAAAFLVSTNSLLSLGFLDYLFTAGLALMLFAAWVVTASWPRWPRAILFAPFVLLLYFGHAFGCAAYCLSVAGFELARAARVRFQPFGAVVMDMLAAFAQAVPALVFATTLDVGSGYVGALHTRYGNVLEKLMALLSPMLFLDDTVELAVICGAVILVLYLLPRLRVASEVWPAALAVGVAALAVPHVLFSTWSTDLRLPLVTVLLLLSAVSFANEPGRWSGFWRWGAFAVLAMLLGAKSADAWGPLHRLDAEIAETRRVVAIMPRGSRLLVVEVARQTAGLSSVPVGTYWHMPMVAVIDRDAFLPTLFSGLTTVQVRPPFRLASTPNGPPITPAELAEGLVQHDVAGIDVADGPDGGRLYHLGWVRKFDYVLVRRFGRDPGKLPDDLQLVVHAADMDLYRVRAD